MLYHLLTLLNWKEIMSSFWINLQFVVNTERDLNQICKMIYVGWSIWQEINSHKSQNILNGFPAQHMSLISIFLSFLCQLRKQCLHEILYDMWQKSRRRKSFKENHSVIETDKNTLWRRWTKMVTKTIEGDGVVTEL